MYFRKNTEIANDTLFSIKDEISADISEMFAQPQYAEEWLRRTAVQFAPWVKRYNKSYWDLIRFYGFQKGILKKTSRKEFAHLLITTYPQALDKNDTERSLISNMEKFPYKQCFHKRSVQEREQQCPDKEFTIELMPDSHTCNVLIRELDKLWTTEPPMFGCSTMSVMEERLEKYLNTCTQTQLYNKVRHHPYYGSKTVSFSVEQYVNQKFMDQEEPSHVIVYDCYDGVVSEAIVNQYAGQYFQKPFIKVYICSNHAFDIRTQKVARNSNIGLMLINPLYEVTEENYVVPRTIGLYDIEEMKLDMLSGKRTMTSPFILYDEQGATFSLVDTLKYHGIKVNNNVGISVPFYSDEYIERVTLKMVYDKVDDFIRKIKDYRNTRQIPQFVIDPKQLLVDEGYQLEEADLSSTGKLAFIDIKGKKVTIDSTQSKYISRLRYTHAHELGHAILHSNINVFAFGESTTTTDINAFTSDSEQKRLEHHANYFASCLLMPTDVVGYLYSYYYQKHFECYTIRPFYLEDQPYKRNDLLCIIAPMAKKMNVSIEALKWRLVKLGLLIISD